MEGSIHASITHFNSLASLLLARPTQLILGASVPAKAPLSNQISWRPVVVELPNQRDFD